MRIQLNTKDIESLATNNATYERGRSYYRYGYVTSLSYDPGTQIVHATVAGTSKYSVKVKLNRSGKVDGYSCTCPAFDDHPLACKHIIATVFKAADTVQDLNTGVSSQSPGSDGLSASSGRTGNTGLTVIAGNAGNTGVNDNNRKSEQSLNKIDTRRYNIFKNLLRTISAPEKDESNSEQKKPINLYITLNYYPQAYEKPTLELQAGLNRLYIVKDIAEFASATLNGNQIEYGKQFTFDPGNQYFHEKDQPFIHLLQDVFLDGKSSNFGNPYSYSSQKRCFYLDTTRFRKFIEMAEHMQNVMWLNTRTRDCRRLEVSREKLPVRFRLDRKNDITELSFESAGQIHTLSPRHDMFLAEGKFYLPPTEETRFLIPYLDAFISSSNQPLPLKDEDVSAFISYALPILNKASAITISDQLKTRIVEEPLSVKIWFDRYNNGIDAKVEFQYGETILNPCIKQDSEAASSILIRDRQQEQTVLEILQLSGFARQKSRFVLSDEDQIYEFLSSKIPLLTEKADVYYSDAFGSLKVVRPPKVSASIRLAEDTDLLEIDFQIDGIAQEDLKNFFIALKEKKHYIRLKNGSFIPMNTQETLTAAIMLEQLGITGNDLSKKVVELPKYRAMYLDQVMRTWGKEHFSQNTYFRRLVQDIKEPQDLEFLLPESLEGILRDYQKIGFRWLKTLSMYGFGGILADDMGLGKTLQMIAFILSDYQYQKKPSLVVAPTTLVYNWQEEIRKFAPSLPVAIIDGNKDERMSQINNAENAAIVITSYALIRRDIDELSKLHFAYCILDEAQNIKNPATLNAKSVKQIKARAYFALTGTPIENTLTELWSVFDYLMPGYLFAHNKFVAQFESPIIKNKSQDALAELGKYIRPFLLRRLKKDVLSELPEKIETKSICEMNTEQKKIYLAYLAKARSEFEAEVGSNGFEKSQIKILSLLTRLRQICCHPQLFLENYTGESGKLDLLEELMQEALDGGHRILLFSQFTSMLQIIQDRLIAHKIQYFYIDGQVPAQERIQRVNAFNQGEGQVFLISLKAGGTGLNLTGADTVIHYDPWWNPSVENQATDRAYRIGQKKTVQVFKLVTRGTIEEKIYALQQKKLELVDAVIKPGESFINKMTIDEVRGLFD